MNIQNQIFKNKNDNNNEKFENKSEKTNKSK